MSGTVNTVDTPLAAVGAPLSMRRIVETWWPLAASWLLMAVEGPLMSAVVARMAYPEITLAAWGGIIWPLALIIESPIIMLLSASTALSKDWHSYWWVRRFMMWAGGLLTALHLAIAFTPLYDFVVVGLIGAPAEIVGPGRIGMIIMTPWTWAIAYRRFHQGVLIRFGHSGVVGRGTVVRLAADSLVLGVGYLWGSIPGIVVAATAIAAGVVSEAAYIGVQVRPVLRGQLRQAAPVERPVTLSSFTSFYTPLALTAALNMLVQPLISAALSRMPAAIDSLAVWSVISGFVFLLRSLSYAYNEVVIALLDTPGARRNLWRFAVGLAVGTSGLLLLIAGTPLASIWFGNISALNQPLAALASRALWWMLPLPALTAFQSWYQGNAVHDRHTRVITEAVVAFLVVDGLALGAGVWLGRIAGVYVGAIGFSLGLAAQVVWLWWRRVVDDGRWTTDDGG